MKVIRFRYFDLYSNPIFFQKISPKKNTSLPPMSKIVPVTTSVNDFKCTKFLFFIYFIVTQKKKIILEEK